MSDEWTTLPTLLSLAEAHRDGWEIETCLAGWDKGWVKWNEKFWMGDYSFRGRPVQEVKQ